MVVAPIVIANSRTDSMEKTFQIKLTVKISHKNQDAAFAAAMEYIADHLGETLEHWDPETEVHMGAGADLDHCGFTVEFSNYGDVEEVE